MRLNVFNGSLYFGDFMNDKERGRNYDEVCDLDALQEVRCEEICS